VTYVGSDGKNYLAFPNGNFLELYNQNVILFGQQGTDGNAKGQISALGSFGGRTGNEIKGYWIYNDSQYAFRTYYVDTSTGLMTKQTEINFTDMKNTTGVRCYDLDQMTCLSWVWMFNDTYVENYTISIRKVYANGTYVDGVVFNSKYYPKNTPTIDDWNADGVFEALGYSSNDIWVVDINTLVTEFNKSEGKSFNNVTSGTYIISSAMFGKIDATPYDKLLVLKGLDYGCFGLY
jgi:hypothetical protein